MRLPKPDNKNRLENSDATNADIIDCIHRNFPKAVEQSRSFAKQFESTNRIATAHKIWTFLKSHVTYKKDSAENQLVRLPARFLKDQQGDCKSFSLATAGILAALGMPVNFRYASYTGSRTPSHVYVTTKDENGREIIIDPVWRFFNSEKKPAYTINKPMKVYTLSGTQEQEVGSFFSNLFKEAGKVVKATGKGIKNFGTEAAKVVKATGKGAANVGTEAFKAAKLVGLAVPRRAFRTLVALNVHGWATKLERSYKANPSKVTDSWKKLGGDKNGLLNSINAGRKRKAILGTEQSESLNGIGVAPAGVVAILAAAAPIIIALLPVIKSLGGDKTPQGTTPAGETTLDKAIDIVQQAARAAGTPAYDAYEAIDAGEVDIQDGEDDTPGLSINPVYIGIAAVAIILLIKSKK